MSVSGKINIDPAIIDLPNVMLTGTAINGYQFLVNGNDLVNVSGNTYEFSNVLASEAFPIGIVNFFYPLMIDWEISYNIGADPTVGCIGMSENPVYVTAGVPDLLYPDNILLPPNLVDGDYLRQTILHVGCEKSKGLSDVTAIVNAIYSEFQDQQIISIHDNIAYEYWGVVENWQNDPYTLSVGGVPNSLDAMLIYNKGRCGAFARLFSSAIKVHGIQGVENKIVYMKSTSNDLEIGSSIDTYVYYNWSQQDYDEFLDQAKKDSNVPINDENFYIDEFIPTQNGFEKQPLKNMFIKDMDVNGEKNFVFDITDAKGAQGNFKPRPYFQNHQIIKFGNKYYDPSYGTGHLTRK